jgi:hypothetical protein
MGNQDKNISAMRNNPGDGCPLEVCVPHSIHARLQYRAKAEGVGLNQLVTAYVSEGLGRHNSAF